MDYLEIDKKLIKLLKKMDIPVYRKDKFNKNNLEWLQKNLHYKNSTHPNYNFAMEIINKKIDNKEYSN